MTLSENAVIFVDHAEQIGAYELRLTFNDATQRVIDFSIFLRGSRNPQIQEYLDPAAFARFEVKDGDLMWDDFGLCFPVSDLYEGRV